MKCNRCNKTHDGSFGSGKFCSRNCANSRGPRTEDFKEKVSKKLKGNIPWNKDKVIVPFEKRDCPTCNNIFEVKKTSKKVYCTPECNPNRGGYREGSGRSKSGYYKGIYCGSTYELVWVIFRLDHNLPVKRFDGCLKDDNLTYFPDFINGNTIIEIKGYEKNSSVEKKNELARNKGYSIVVLYKKDLKREFNWVRSNYKFKNVYELYDGYKPKYSYTCCGCGNSFETDKIRKTERVFCSKKCIKPIAVTNKLGINQYTRRQ